MRNENTPAMPTHENADGHFKDPKTCKLWEPHHGFTKYERALLEFAKAAIAHESHASDHDIMVRAKRLAKAYFQHLELDQ